MVDVFSLSFWNTRKAAVLPATPRKHRLPISTVETTNEYSIHPGVSAIMASLSAAGPAASSDDATFVTAGTKKVPDWSDPAVAAAAGGMTSSSTISGSDRRAVQPVISVPSSGTMSVCVCVVVEALTTSEVHQWQQCVQVERHERVLTASMASAICRVLISHVT